jgi:hypothetical protein
MFSLNALAATPQFTSFTYQGKLSANGQPANGHFDMVFRLYDAESGGAPVGNAYMATQQTVVNGVFAIDLGFPGVPFDGQQYWIQATVGTQDLTPRQPVNSVPVAQYALTSPASDFADFYALMPPDNAATVGVGSDVQFPQDGPKSPNAAVTRTSDGTFQLRSIGTYQVMFQVSVNEPGQLVLTLNGTDLGETVVGRATGTSEIVGMALVQTTVVNSILSVRNPAGNSTALTITPLAGGTRPVSAHLVITRLN